MRVLLTNFTLAGRTGTEIVTRDFALGLLDRGHSPAVFSPRLGTIAEEIRAAGVPVIQHLDRLTVAPEVVHGNHHCQLLAALLRFPGARGVLSCHDWEAFHSVPLDFPRIGRYIAVDEVNFDLLTHEHGIGPERVRLLSNALDPGRFLPRGPLPPKPARALVFNNNLHEGNGLAEIRAACELAGMELDVRGAAAGTGAENAPEALLPKYDLVFAVARSALEALAAGCAVVLADHRGLGGMVTGERLSELRRHNFGLRALRQPLTSANLVAEIARYDANDSAQVTARVRREANLGDALETLLGIYREALADAQTGEPDGDVERLAVSDYLEAWESRVEQAMWREKQSSARALAAELELARLRAAAIPSPTPAPIPPRGWLDRWRLR